MTVRAPTQVRTGAFLAMAGVVFGCRATTVPSNPTEESEPAFKRSLRVGSREGGPSPAQVPDITKSLGQQAAAYQPCGSPFDTEDTGLMIIRDMLEPGYNSPERWAMSARSDQIGARYLLFSPFPADLDALEAGRPEVFHWCGVGRVVMPGEPMQVIEKGNCEILLAPFQVGPVSRWSRRPFFVMDLSGPEGSGRWFSWCWVDVDSDGLPDVEIRHRCCGDGSKSEREMRSRRGPEMVLVYRHVTDDMCGIPLGENGVRMGRSGR